MAVPFGFSIGDFTAVISITWKVIQSLREVGGSIPQVQAMLETLLLFNRTITTCQTLAMEWVPLSTGHEQSIINGVNHQLKLCHQKLNDLSMELHPYTTSFMRPTPLYRTYRDQLMKIKWLFKKEDAEKLQRELRDHVQGLEISFTSLRIQTMMRTMLQYESNTAKLKSIEERVSDIYAMVYNMYSQLPQQLGYTREGRFSTYDAPVIVMDALGRTVPIPFLVCTSKKSFHDMLELIFRGLPGHGMVTDGKYHLEKHKTGEVIEASEWPNIVAPGSTIVMSVIVRKIVYDDHLPSENRTRDCPRCGEKLNQLAKTSMRCPRCFKDVRFTRVTCQLGTGYSTIQPSRPPRHKLRRKDFKIINKPEDIQRPQNNSSKSNESSDLLTLQRVHMIHEELSGSQQMRVGTMDFELSALAKGYNLDPTLAGVYAMILSGSLYDWEYLLRHVMDVEQRCDDASHRQPFDNFTLLQLALAFKKLELVEFLLQAGANVNAPAAECRGGTALGIAAQHANGEMVELLLAAGACVVEEPIHSNALTTLEYAIWGGHVSGIQLIIGAGTNVNSVSYLRLLLYCLTYHYRDGVQESLRRTVKGLGDLEVDHILRVNMLQFLRIGSKSMHSEDGEENYDSDNHEVYSRKGEYGENTRGRRNCTCLHNVVKEKDIEWGKKILRDLAMDTLGFRVEELSDSEAD